MFWTESDGRALVHRPSLAEPLTVTPAGLLFFMKRLLLSWSCSSSRVTLVSQIHERKKKKEHGHLVAFRGELGVQLDDHNSGWVWRIQLPVSIFRRTEPTSVEFPSTDSHLSFSFAEPVVLSKEPTVRIQCLSGSMIITVKDPPPSPDGKFSGMIYPKGLSKNSTCLSEYRWVDHGHTFMYLYC